MTEQIFTVGHSNRTLDEFLALLADSGVAVLVDVRRLPGSRRHPQFNEGALAQSLSENGIDFRRAAGLTGRRPVSQTVLPEVNAWWQNRSFHNYADHALSNEFRAALSDLRDIGRTRRTAVMCAESVWWRCHRRIIADHLLAHGEHVNHILDRGRVDTAEMSAGAVVGADRVVTYPPR